MKNKIVISEFAKKTLISYFGTKGFEVVLFNKMNKPYEAVSDHPDMFMFYDDKLFLERDVTQHLSKETLKCEPIDKKYPLDIKYNVCKVGNNIICKYDYISEDIKVHIVNSGYDVIDVNQGYAKCSTCIVDESSIITSDKSIQRGCVDKGLDVLLIEPEHIICKGLEYGFIGGSSVSFDDIVFFNGDITKHPNYEEINRFIKSKNKKIEFMDYPLEDLGSFIIIKK